MTFKLLKLLPILAALAGVPHAKAADKPIEIRVVVVTTFEVGKETGDIPGEFQHWVERYPLTETLPFPMGNRPLRYNPKDHVLGIVTSMGKVHATASIMALAMDPRFDFSKAYWILAGIAGIDPAKGSIGSAVWAHYAVDGDLGFEIDAREIPRDWETGNVPDGKATPFQKPPPKRDGDDGIEAYSLNAGLADWAYGLTAGMTLPDNDRLKANRAKYVDYPAALKPPSVMVGDTLTADRFWVGGLMTKWAEKWVPYWTDDKGVFVTSAEEDVGYLQALTYLAKIHKVDFSRALDLRTASDFTIPPPDKTVADFLAGEASGSGYGAYMESVEAAYLVGGKVVSEIATHWDKYADHVPAGSH
ncbi:MAG TPA: purine nucleoside permease [Alphaproteobacteria bacterium]|jgi:purine nucleoside permease|nr:purine nucleoside permease [Alphaproteobacteria bacterium]